MRTDDAVRLRHMLDSSREAIEFLGSTSRDAPAETRAAHPGVPWSVITAMRNRLVHGSFDIDYHRVWDTARADPPVLIAELERILAADQPA